MHTFDTYTFAAFTPISNMTHRMLDLVRATMQDIVQALECGDISSERLVHEYLGQLGFNLYM